MRIAVVGASGTAGRPVVREALSRGHEVVGVARRPSGLPDGVRRASADVTDGRGIAEALVGVDVVVDVSNSASGRQETAREFFVGGTRRLQEAAAAAGARHHVLLSIVGVDVVPLGYYRAKLAQEDAALDGQVPATVLRSTQFHEFPGQVVRRTKRLGTAAVPTMRVRTVATTEVATVLVDLAEAGPVGRAPDLGGPEEARLPELARRWAAAVGERVLVVPLRLPGAAGRLMASGGLLPRDGRTGAVRFDDWLATLRAPS